jgi:hypothetical protein
MILKHILKASKPDAAPQSLKNQPPTTPKIPSVSAFDTSSARFRVKRKQFARPLSYYYLDDNVQVEFEKGLEGTFTAIKCFGGFLERRNGGKIWTDW